MSENSNILPLSHKHFQAMTQRITRAAAKKLGAEHSSDPTPSGLVPEGSQTTPSSYKGCKTKHNEN